MTSANLAAIFGCAGPVLLPEERAFFRAADPFGFILFARNIEAPAQVARLCADLRDAVGHDAPILIDQEGGRVQRMRGPHWREWQPPFDMLAQARDPERAIYLQMRLIADELRGVGIDANCAPCADVAQAQTHPFLRNRCYGETAETVTRLARAASDGLLAGGVLPVVKHLPGHGRATADSHKDLPQVDASREELARIDFAPFAALKYLPMAMTAHIVFKAYDAALPATQSPEMIRVIREEIGFEGLLMTDDLNMQALSGDLGQRTASSMAAGCDIALHCKGDMAEMQMVAAACGRLNPAALIRADRALAQRHAPDAVDIAALAAEFDRLMPTA